MRHELKATAQTLAIVLEEAQAQVRVFEQAVQAFLSVLPETEAHHKAEANLAVEAHWLKLKAEALIEVLEEKQ